MGCECSSSLRAAEARYCRRAARRRARTRTPALTLTARTSGCSSWAPALSAHAERPRARRSSHLKSGEACFCFFLSRRPARTSAIERLHHRCSSPGVRSLPARVGAARGAVRCARAGVLCLGGTHGTCHMHSPGCAAARRGAGRALHALRALPWPTRHSVADCIRAPTAMASAAADRAKPAEGSQLQVRGPAACVGPHQRAPRAGAAEVLHLLRQGRGGQALSQLLQAVLPRVRHGSRPARPPARPLRRPPCSDITRGAEMAGAQAAVPLLPRPARRGPACGGPLHGRHLLGALSGAERH
jgi:hypothetical protein